MYTTKNFITCISLFGPFTWGGREIDGQMAWLRQAKERHTVVCMAKHLMWFLLPHSAHDLGICWRQTVSEAPGLWCEGVLVMPQTCSLTCKIWDKKRGTGTWMAESIKWLTVDFRSDHDLRVVRGSQPFISLCYQWGVCLRFFLPLPLPIHPAPPPMLSHSLSLLKKKKKSRVLQPQSYRLAQRCMLQDKGSWILELGHVAIGWWGDWGGNGPRARQHCPEGAQVVYWLFLGVASRGCCPTSIPSFTFPKCTQGLICFSTSWVSILEEKQQDWEQFSWLKPSILLCPNLSYSITGSWCEYVT